MMMPAWLMAGVLIVGDWDALGEAPSRLERLRQSEIQYLHHVVVSHFDVGRLQIAVNDAMLVCGFQSLGDLSGDFQCLVERHRPCGDTVRQCGSFDQLHHERVHARRHLETVHVSDVRVIQRRQRFRFALEAGESISVGRKGVREVLIATSRPSDGSYAR